MRARARAPGVSDERAAQSVLNRRRPLPGGGGVVLSVLEAAGGDARDELARAGPDGPGRRA